MLRSARTTWIRPALLLLAGLGAIGDMSLRPKAPTQPVAAVFPFWWDAGRSFGAVASAGGVILRTGAWPWLVITQSPKPGFAKRLHTNGAWLLLDPQALGTCTQSIGGTTT